jgi:hypothetical protein
MSNVVSHLIKCIPLRLNPDPLACISNEEKLFNKFSMPFGAAGAEEEELLGASICRGKVQRL